MSKITITQSNVIPFYEQDWVTPMQMKFSEITVSVSQEDSETLEQITTQLDEVMQERMDKQYNKIPKINIMQKQLILMKLKLEKLMQPPEFAKFIKEVKNI